LSLTGGFYFPQLDLEPSKDKRREAKGRKISKLKAFQSECSWEHMLPLPTLSLAIFFSSSDATPFFFYSKLVSTSYM
jgi:hypothetical protein